MLSVEPMYVYSHLKFKYITYLWLWYHDWVIYNVESYFISAAPWTNTFSWTKDTSDERLVSRSAISFVLIDQFKERSQCNLFSEKNLELGDG